MGTDGAEAGGTGKDGPAERAGAEPLEGKDPAEGAEAEAWEEDGPTERAEARLLAGREEEEEGAEATRWEGRRAGGRARRMGGVAFCLLAGSLLGLWGSGGAGWLAGVAVAGTVGAMACAGKGWSRWLVWGAMLACAAANGQIGRAHV